MNNLTLELAFADPDFRAELRRLFDLWRATIAGKYTDRARGEALAAIVVAAYSGAMAMAKVEQRGEPLRIVREGASRSALARALIKSLLEPVMRIRLIVERRELFVAEASVQMLCLAKRLVRFKPHLAIAHRSGSLLERVE